LRLAFEVARATLDEVQARPRRIAGDEQEAAVAQTEVEGDGVAA
jgi:hypothetical protein